MKKITFLLLAILPLIGFGQIVTNSTFDADIAGWASSGSASWSATEGNAALGSAEFIAAAGNNFRTSPNTQLAVAGDYEASFWIKGAIGTTIKAQVFGLAAGNPSGPDLEMTGNWIKYTHTFTDCLTGINGNLRIVGVTAGTFYVDDVYFEFQIPPGSTFLTTTTNGLGTITKTPDQSYYAPTDNVTVEAVPATHWNFDSWSGDLTGSTNPETILMDADKAVTANFVIDPTFDYNFTFDIDGDLEGWTADAQFPVTAHTGGLVTFTTEADGWARFDLNEFPIPTTITDPAKYNKVTIKLQNPSATTDELGIAITNNVETTTIVYPMSTSDATIQSYDIDLTQFLAWNGDITKFRIRFADADNPSLSSKPTESHDIIIDDITFSFDASLSSKNFDKVDFTMYPNPARGQLNFNYQGTINKVQIFDITGKQVLTNNGFEKSTQIDISNLHSGLYLVKLTDVNKRSSIKKLVLN